MQISQFVMRLTGSLFTKPQYFSVSTPARWKWRLKIWHAVVIWNEFTLEGVWRYRYSLTYVVAAFQKFWCKSELSIHMDNYMRVCTWESNPISRTQESDWPPHDRNGACVVTQHFSSATFISSHFHSHKEKFTKFLKVNIFNFFYFLIFLKVH
jgi:hypothetical protein